MEIKELNAMLVKNARILVYAIAFVIALATFSLYSTDGKPSIDSANAFGYLAFTFISIGLMISPIKAIWPNFGLNPTLNMARRAIGVSAFVFAAFHFSGEYVAGFGTDFDLLIMSLGLNIFLLFGAIAMMVLFLLFITSTDFAVRKLGKYWFKLHKLLYLAYPLIIAHAYFIGLDFIDGMINMYSGSFLLIALATISLEFIKIYISARKRQASS